MRAGFTSPRETQYPDLEIVKEGLTQAFADSNSEVYRMISDVRFSGSTCTSIITYGRKVYCANVGDSRTILIRTGNAGDEPGSK